MVLLKMIDERLSGCRLGHAIDLYGPRTRISLVVVVVVFVVVCVCLFFSVLLSLSLLVVF